METAEYNYKEAIESVEQNRGHLHTITLRAKSRYGAFLVDLGRNAEAEQWLREANAGFTARHQPASILRQRARVQLDDLLTQQAAN